MRLHKPGQLTRNHNKDDEYKLGQKFGFSCKTLGDYHDIYLKTDVLLLANVFEKFRDKSMYHYDLDPTHYFSSLGMSWNALLKKTKIELELSTDTNMHLFFEKGLRGGMSMVSKRFAKANNPQGPDYDDSKPNNWLLYLDGNNH